MSKYILPLLLATAFSAHAMEKHEKNHNISLKKRIDDIEGTNKDLFIKYTLGYNKYFNKIRALRFNEDTGYLISLITDLNSNEETEYACFMEKKEIFGGNYICYHEREITPEQDIINILRQKTVQYRDIMQDYSSWDIFLAKYS